ncbi:PCI domain-containing protein [Ophiocordyceps camponoti-floridani]|uniref:PCI domain-containing protein n=1 Tax=Ophiocordyceps camponoti-floridani TaxID=2030778 RepID=A0A8H4Q639_9HYPO|nr:PCI domain-containing protein [Ophiocordyceps camponoti-floridani]
MSLLGQFLTQIRSHVREKRDDNLGAWLSVDPPSPKPYHDLAAELRRNFTTQESLDLSIDAILPLEDDDDDGGGGGGGGVWPSFQVFIRDYLVFWRDVDYGALVEAHELLTVLVNSCGTAFTHPQHGALLIHVSISLCETLARLTLQLNRRPDLTRRIRSHDDEGSSKTIAESSAETIQKIFKTCLMDRSSGRKPEGKKVGVYRFANLVTKLLFACRRTNLATMIFRNISASSPPLHLYPASQRVTYLYYLGRYNLSTSHYLRATLCLEQAYLQTPPHLTSHRANILTYLIPCNMLIGRFPSAALLSRAEAHGLRPIFLPLCQAIRSGNFLAFQAHLSANEAWLFEKGLYLSLCHRLRPLLWRSLARKTFLLTYIPPTNDLSRRAATLDLSHLHTAAIYMQRRLQGWLPATSHMIRGRPPHLNPLLVKAVTKNVHAPDATTTLIPPPVERRLRPNEGLIWGDAAVSFDDVEMMVASLVQQELMHGFVAHGQARFAIIGAKAKGPVLAGWPVVAQAIRERRYDESFEPDEVPGWVMS